MTAGTITQIISAVGVVCAASISAYTARQTLRMVRTMESSNELNSRPVISVSLEDHPQNSSLVDLAITNAGNGLARNIAFELKGEDIVVSGQRGLRRHLSDLRIIGHGVKTLAPHEIRRYWLMSLDSSQRSRRVRKADIRLGVSYCNSTLGKIYTDEFELDFGSLPEARASDDPLYRLAQNADEIREQLFNNQQNITSRNRSNKKQQS